MQISEILTGIDEEISRLQQVRDLLGGNNSRRAGRPPAAAATATSFSIGGNDGTAPKKRHKMSAAGRARIAAAQKARWAKLKKTKAAQK